MIFNNIHNVKIGKRLNTVFGTLLGLLIAVCVMSAIAMQITNRSLSKIMSIHEKKLTLVTGIKEAIDSITRSVAIIPFANPVIIMEEKNKIETNRQRYRKAIEEYEKLIETESEKNALENLVNALKASVVNNNIVLELAEESNKSQAESHFLNETRKTADVATAAANALLKVEQDIIKDEIEKVTARNKRLTLIVAVSGILAIIISIFMSLKIIQSLKIPIERIVAHLKTMADGNLDVKVSQHALSRKDEFGDIARAMHDLTENMKKVLGSVINTTHRLSSSAVELSSIAEKMSEIAENSASQVSLVAAATEEMSQTNGHIAKNTVSIAESSKKALNIAKEGNDIVSKTVSEVIEIDTIVKQLAEFIKMLGEKSRHINNIVNVINDIADQTNLLALNAAIEAARAGEHGKGFAVVADEVRKLAERTTNSTKEIDEMIGTIQREVNKAIEMTNSTAEKVHAGVQYANTAGTILKDIVKNSEELQTMVSQIASATEEMSATSEEISKKILDIANALNEATISSQETSKMASDLSDIATKLKEQVDFFQLPD